ncbi:hypothetical protein AAFF_G00016880 [Aldrovandia affinis]|uniref:CW-type domain-containing protein n=1 Tax=Aldrovandia affinis TaxID=143900 RepID=A0AAD7S6H1_9TELE|nr:hypothetical protein AAFF_G00016880 [Aldrovandia affinis]
MTVLHPKRKRPRNKESKHRSVTVKYQVLGVPVCAIAFQGITNIKRTRLQNIASHWKQHHNIRNETRGGRRLYQGVKKDRVSNIAKYWQTHGIARPERRGGVRNMEKKQALNLKALDPNWAQCDDCLKWRKLPDGIEPNSLPDEWFCHMNPDPQYRFCRVEEEPEDSKGDQLYETSYEQQEKENKLQQDWNGQQVGSYFSVAWKNSEIKKSGVAVPTPSTSTTPLSYAFTQRTTGGAVTSLTTTSCSPPNSSGHSPSSRKLTISNEDMPYPSSRMKRKLWTPKNKEVKRSKVNSQQMSISADSNNIIFVGDGSSSTGALNLVKVKTEPGDREIGAEMRVGLSDGAPKERSMKTDTTETAALPPSHLPHHLTSPSNQMDGILIVKKEEEEEEERKRDHSAVEGGPISAEQGEAREDTDTKEGVKTEGAVEEENQQWLLLETQQQRHLQLVEKVKPTFQERDQYSETPEAVTQERDQYSETPEAVTQERDQYREQVKQLACQVKELEEQLGQNNKERDELKSKCERLQTELEELRRETLSSSRPVERTLNGQSRNTEDPVARRKMTVSW